MAKWQVQHGDGGEELREVEEEKILRKLRSGHYSGLEMARPGPGEPWRKLRDWPTFADEVLPGAAWRVLLPWVGHLGTYLIVNIAVGWELWMAGFWGLALLTHGLQVWRLAAPELLGDRALPAPAEAPLPASTTPTPAAPPPGVDAWLAELDAALARLPADGIGADLAALRAAGASLHQRRLALAAVAGPEAHARLQHALDAALEAADEARDPRTREALLAEAEGLDTRLKTQRDAAEALARVEARERTLLHQLHALHTQLLLRSADEGAALDLGSALSGLRAQAEAGAEVETDLARARLAAQAQRQPAGSR